LKKDRQHNGQRKKTKRQTYDLQNNTHKTKDRATRSPLKTGVNAGAPEGLAVPAPYNLMLNSGKKICAFARQLFFIPTLVLSEKKILSKTKNHAPPAS
jgi:hypothetical protein